MGPFFRPVLWNTEIGSNVKQSIKWYITHGHNRRTGAMGLRGGGGGGGGRGCSPYIIFRIAIFWQKYQVIIFGQNHLPFVQAMEKYSAGKRLQASTPNETRPVCIRVLSKPKRVEYVHSLRSEF